MIVQAVNIMILLGGILALLRPVLLLYLLCTLQVVTYIPVISQYNPTLLIFRVGSINVFAQDYLICILGILLLCTSIYNYSKNRSFFKSLFKSPITIAILLLFTWEIFIGYLSYQKGFSVQNVMRRFSVESLMFVTLLMPQIKDIEVSKYRFFKYMVILSVVLVALAFLRYAVTNEVEYTSSMTRRTILGNTVVIFLFPLCYILFNHEAFSKSRIISYLTIFLILLGINFTGHRSGYLVIIFVIVLWMIEGKYFQKELIWVPIWGTVAVLFIVLIIPIYAKEIKLNVRSNSLFGDVVIRYMDTFDTENTTTLERLSKWQYSYDTAMEAPILGLGRFQFYTASGAEDLNTNLEVFSEVNRSPHNLFATKLLHQGFIGLIVLLTFFFVVIKQTRYILNEDRSYAGFLRAYLFAFIFFSFFNTAFESATSKVYFFIALGFINIKIVSYDYIKNLQSQ